jgi:hypothetical protein
VAELDAIAEKAGKAAKDDLKKLVGELEEAAKKLEGDAKANGELYVKLAKKALDKVGGVVYNRVRRCPPLITPARDAVLQHLSPVNQ